MAEQRSYKPPTEGPIPSPPTRHQGGATVTRLPVKERIAGSNPAPGAKWPVRLIGRMPPPQGEDVGSNPARATN